MSARHRPWSRVPAWVPVALAALLLVQVAWRVNQHPDAPTASDLPPAPKARTLRLLAMGEPETLARLGMVYLQSFDLNAGNRIPYRELDYGRLADWLAALLTLDPRSQYPMFAAARVYAEVPDPARQRQMLEFVHQQFLADPERRWPWMAHAALVAKHRLRDLSLARVYAQAVDRNTTSRNVPLWARQMEIFILEDMKEIDAARIMLGGLLASGQIEDPAELRFLEQRLRDMEAASGSGSKAPGQSAGPQGLSTK